jgi:hypothetical protein
VRGGRARVWFCGFVNGVDELPGAQQAIDGAPGHRTKRSTLPQVFGVWRWHGERGDGTKRLVFVAV